MFKLLGVSRGACPIWSALGLALMLPITATAEDGSSTAYYSTSQFSVSELDRKMYLRDGKLGGRGVSVRVQGI